MKEILFRGKRIDNGEWAYSQTVFSHLDNFYIPTQNLKCTVMRNLDTVGNISEIRCKDGKCFFKVHPETVGQYTGLTDKNGKKIFEGDVLKICYGSPLFDGYDTECICYNGIVKYENALFVCEENSERGDALCMLSSNEFEIIGNIYDNPELLEVTE